MSLICACSLAAGLALCVQMETSSTSLLTVEEVASQISSTSLEEQEVHQLVESLSQDPPLTDQTVSIDVAQYRWTIAGPDGTASGPIRPQILLRYSAFDPLVRAPGVAPSFALDESRIRIVQFWTPPIELYEEQLLSVGAEVLKFLPEQCLIVRADNPAALAALPNVRWTGAYHPAYRLDPQLLPAVVDEALGVAGEGEAEEYSIQVFKRGAVQKRTLATYIQSIGGQVTRSSPGGFLLRARLSAAQLRQVLHRDEVHYVDRIEGPPGEDVDLARRIGWADGLEDFAGLRGQGVRAEVMDGSIRATHADFQNPPPLLHGPIAGDQIHGTQVYGLVFSKGVSTPAARGLLPGAEQGIFADYGQMIDRYAHTARLVDPAGPYRAVFQTNSWGNTQTTDYTTISMELDDIAFINDIVILQSQSNTGTTESRPESWSKNVVSVGAVSHQNNLDRSDDCWCGNASKGPAGDGRIKPDLAHFGDAITTSSRSSDFAFTTNFSGTSAATPITAGYFGLMFQMWHEGFFPGFGRADSVFLSRPHMTTAKALMINTARQYEFHGLADDMSRYHQGWGLVSIRDLFDASERALIVDESVLLRPFGSVRYNVRVAPGAPELCATLTWSDPPGNTAAAVDRINDLDLLLIAPDATAYRGNVGLRDGPYSIPGGEHDRIDTVENIIVPNPAPGVYTVIVSGTGINEDGHRATPQRDSAFALVVSGIAGAGCPADWDRSGTVALADLLAFLDSWFGGDADLDADGVTDVSDLLGYLDAFFASCVA